MKKFEPATNGDAIVGVGNSMYTTSGAGGPQALTLRQVLTNYTNVIKIIDFRGSDGNLFAYVSGGGGEYHRSSDGVTWTTAGSIASSGIVNLGDMIVFDQQIVALAGTNIVSSADGQNWSTDASADAVYRISGSGNFFFVGVAMAPWGEPAVYFIDDGKLHVLDFYIKTAYPIEDVGDQRGIWTGTVWNGSVWITDGLNIYEYNPGRESTVRYQGPFNKQSVPPSWASRGVFSPFPSDDDSYRIIEFIPGISDLFAVCRRFLDASGAFAEPSMRILVYNGTGWSWYGPEVTGSIPAASALFSSSGTEYGRKLAVVSYADQSPADRTLTYHHWRLPIISDIPIVNWKEGFEAGPLPFETGWFDGGFSELEGVLLKLSIDGYNLSATETVRVEYRLNNKEDASYDDLGTFTADQQEIWFNLNQSLDKRGVPFKTVQFRISLDRASSLSSDVTKSPEISALILLFDKTPRIRTSWNIRIDMSRTSERGMLLEEDTPATVEGIWQFLKSLVNTPQLIKMEIPSMEPGGINVRITDMPTTVSEFRESLGGKQAFVELQLIETVSQ